MAITDEQREKRAKTRRATLSKQDSPDAAMLSVNGAATLLNVERQTIYRAIKCGEIHAIQIRNTWRIPRKQLCEQYGIED